MKLVKCKRCEATNVYWVQSINGKWTLNNDDDKPHYCDDGKLKIVKCKYCDSADLHWAEEIDPISKSKKAVLTESYGLPHACSERIAFMAKEKQDKKDKYDAEKKRINATSDGKCSACGGTGNDKQNISNYLTCQFCLGYAHFSERNRKSMLAVLRRKIWPNMVDNLSKHYKW